MALKVNRIKPGILAETRITKFVGEEAILNAFPPIYESLYQNLHMPDYLHWRIVEPHGCAWDVQRELWLITAHRHAGEDLNNAAGAFVLGLYCVPSSTHEELGIHITRQVDADLRLFGKSLLTEVSPQDLGVLTQRGSPPDAGERDNDDNRRIEVIEVLEAQALQLHLSGWTQAIALYVHPEYRHHRIASHLLRSAKRALVEQANVSIGFIGNPHVSAAALWAKVGARFYIGRELPDEELFAITWGRRDACGMLLDMFARCADYPRDQGAAASKADDDFEIPF